MIAGRGPAPSLVLALVQRLPDDSLTIALVCGGRTHFGWGVDRHLLADVYDAINQNTRATGHWAKGKTPTFPPWPRPKPAGPPQPRKTVTVADLWRHMQGR